MRNLVRTTAVIGAGIVEAFSSTGANACNKECPVAVPRATVARPAPVTPPAPATGPVILYGRQTVTTTTTTEFLLVVPQRGTAIEQRQQKCGTDAKPGCGGGGGD